ncbi:diacylglycerol/lipid kinase family protein [Caproicibacter sp.]|uniref:diacylglycerol/lipid kinase family protein n=1 Tax=Caproicibacter sp. TaxID=2814884 RepID=UPI003988D6AC
MKNIKLIYNPSSGKNKKSPVQLTDILTQLQSSGFTAEPFLIEPDSDLSQIVRESLSKGIDLFLVCGGDGTVSSAVRALYGTNSTIGIIPAGTQNNIAFSLGIPLDIPSAVSVLSAGLRTRVDVGMVTCGGIRTPFLEVCSIGLLSSLFSSADQIQHGNLVPISDFLLQFVKNKPCEFEIRLDDRFQITGDGYALVAANMPYIFHRYRVGEERSYQDGFLNLYLVAEMSKLDLVGCAVKSNLTEDPRIHRLCAKKIEIKTSPEMPVMADGIGLGKGPALVEMKNASVHILTALPDDPKRRPVL